MSTTNMKPTVQGPTLPPLRTIQQPATHPESQMTALPSSTNRLPPLRRPVYPSQVAARTTTANASAGLAPTIHASEFPNAIHRDIALSMATQDSLSRSLEKAFNVYNERLRDDLRDFRGVCTSLVAQEQQETMKWYTLCLKVMKERDSARQQLHLLSLERNARTSTSPPTSPGFHDQEVDAARALKRGREDVVLPNSHQVASPSSRSSSAEARPIRPLRLSPVHSPLASPVRMSNSPPAPEISSSGPSTSSSAYTSPPSSAASPCFDSQPTIGDHRPGKRRKSCEAESRPNLASLLSPIEVKEQPRTPSPLSFHVHLKSLPTQPHLPSGEFSHVDLMYVPMKGSLVCRACILQKSKSSTIEPKSFPTSASWDDLREHCLKSHAEACADVARLRPAEIFELRRRLSL